MYASHSQTISIATRTALLLSNSLYIHDENGDVWIKWFVTGWLSVQVLISPDAYSLFAAGVQAKETFDRRFGEL